MDRSYFIPVGTEQDHSSCPVLFTSLATVKSPTTAAYFTVMINLTSPYDPDMTEHLRQYGKKGLGSYPKLMEGNRKHFFHFNENCH